MLKLLLNLDYRLFNLLNSLAGKSPITDWIFIFLAEGVIYLLVAGFALFAFLEKRQPVLMGVFITSMIASFFSRVVFVSLIRAVHFRERPFVAGKVTQLYHHNPLEASFPSAHTAFMFAIAFSLFSYNTRWGTVYIVLASLSSIARVVIGVHFPADILGGVIVGGISALIAQFAREFFHF